MNIKSLFVWLIIYQLWLCGVYHCWEGLYNYSRRTIPFPINLHSSHLATAGVTLANCFVCQRGELCLECFSLKVHPLPFSPVLTLLSDCTPLPHWHNWFSTGKQPEARKALFQISDSWQSQQNLITTEGNKQFSADTHRWNKPSDYF